VAPPPYAGGSNQGRYKLPPSQTSFLSQLKCKNLGRKQRDTFQKVEFPQTNLTWSLVCIAIVRLMMSMRDIRIAATTHLSGEIV
jgi:hypothetical protein